jgi:RHS repeat-associated protein
VTSLVRDGGVALAYDSDDHVTSVARSGGTTNYAFDGSGRRVRVSSAGTERRFLVAPSLAAGYESPHLVTDGAGATLASYVYAGEHALARYEASGPTYYLRDAMGSVIALADESGARVARLDYDAFGNVRGSAGSASGLPVETAGDFRYHGMWMDPTGLYYVRARSYDPVTGRFVSKDPADRLPTRPEASAPYNFAENAPTVYRDPAGKFTLVGLQTSLNVRSILQTTARQQFKSYLREEAQAAAGELVFDVLSGFVKSVAPQMSMLSTAGRTLRNRQANPVREGIVLGDWLNQALCGIFPSQNLWMEVPISTSGRPSGNGFNCSERVTARTPISRDPRPDLVATNGTPPTELDDTGSKAWLVAEFKRSLRGLSSRWRGRQSRQFRAITRFAEERVYGRLVMVVVANGYKNRRVTETAAAYRMLLDARVVPLIVVLWD